MKIGVYTSGYGDIPLTELLPLVKSLGADAVEFGVGGMYATGKHLVPGALLADRQQLKDVRTLIEDSGLEISGFSVHGNPVHPNAEIAESEIDQFKRACELAAEMGVDRFNVMSGLPAASPRDEVPNWICNPWPQELADGLKYQWEEKLVPYWKWAVGHAAGYGVRYLNIEPHPGMAVYNVESLLRLRTEVGEGIACNFDPSHLVWQGDVDVYEAILALGNLITHAHAKDVFVNRSHVRTNGIFTTTPFGDYRNRPWTFRSPGYGSDPNLWRDIMFAFSVIGYDHVMSIEYEDWHMSPMEGLRRSIETLKTVTNRDHGVQFGSPRPKAG